MSFFKKLIGGVVGAVVGKGGGGQAPAQAAPVRRAFVPPVRSASNPQLDRVAAMRARFSRRPQAQAPQAGATPSASFNPSAPVAVSVVVPADRAVRAVPKPAPNPAGDDMQAYARHWDANNATY